MKKLLRKSGLVNGEQWGWVFWAGKLRNEKKENERGASVSNLEKRPVKGESTKAKGIAKSRRIAVGRLGVKKGPVPKEGGGGGVGWGVKGTKRGRGMGSRQWGGEPGGDWVGGDRCTGGERKFSNFPRVGGGEFCLSDEPNQDGDLSTVLTKIMTVAVVFYRGHREASDGRQGDLASTSTLHMRGGGVWGAFSPSGIGRGGWGERPTGPSFRFWRGNCTTNLITKSIVGQASYKA